MESHQSGSVSLEEIPKDTSHTLDWKWRYSPLTGSSVSPCRQRQEKPVSRDTEADHMQSSADIAGVSWQPSSLPSPPEPWPYSFLAFPEMLLYPYNKFSSVAKAHMSHFCYLQLKSPMTRSLTKIISLKNSWGIYFYWTLVDLQCCVSFRYITEWYIYMCVCMLVAQLCLTLCDPMDCNLPGSSVCWILQARRLEGLSLPGDLTNPGFEHGPPALQKDSLLSEPSGKSYIYIKFSCIYYI